MPDSCHVQCQSPEMQSEHGKPYKPALEEIQSYQPTLLVHLVACVWSDHCLPTHLQFCMFKAIHSSRPSSLLSVLLEACPPNLWPEVISSVTQLLLVMHLFSCIIDTYGFYSLSPFSIGSLTYVFSSSRASSIVLSMQLNMQ